MFARVSAGLEHATDRSVKIGERRRRHDAGPEDGWSATARKNTRPLNRHRERRLSELPQRHGQPLAGIVLNFAQKMQRHVQLFATHRSHAARGIRDQPGKRMPDLPRQVDRDEESLNH